MSSKEERKKKKKRSRLSRPEASGDIGKSEKKKISTR
jgi:hypothetical protein